MQYCSLQHQTLLPSPVTATTTFVFALVHLFIPPRVTSPFFCSSILGTYQPGEFIFQCPIFLPFHTVYGILKARILKWFAIPFSSGLHSVRSLHHDPPVLVAPRPWLSFIELDKDVRRSQLPALCWSSKEIPHAQGKTNPSKTVGVARGHQRADTLKLYSQKTSQSNHTRTIQY